jgi:hypothetical protein
MFDMFYQDIAYVVVVINICCKRVSNISPILDVSCKKCFILQVLSLVRKKQVHAEVVLMSVGGPRVVAGSDLHARAERATFGGRTMNGVVRKYK